jgi:hypothetical protein
MTWLPFSENREEGYGGFDMSIWWEENLKNMGSLRER